MSALQCPARLFLTRPGEATYESDAVGDDGGWLTRTGRQQSTALAARLRGERIARVWSSPVSRAVQTAEIAAAALGVDVVVRTGLRATSGEGRAIGPVLAEAADEHPGEGVLVVSHARAILATVPQLVGLPPDRWRAMRLPRCGVVELEADADGWRLMSCDAEEG
jgi:broad specificity phosphatase PhoE